MDFICRNNFINIFNHAMHIFLETKSINNHIWST
jgi:hypothetical protein